EVPYFSPGELEVAEGTVKSPGPLLDVFAKSQMTFRGPAQLGASPNPPQTNDFPVTRTDGFGSAFRGTVGRGLQLRMLDLVGLTDGQSAKAYSGGKVLERGGVNSKTPKQVQEGGVEIVNPRGKAESNPPPAAAPPLETRALDYFEMAGVEELQRGKDVY